MYMLASAIANIVCLTLFLMFLAQLAYLSVLSVRLHEVSVSRADAGYHQSTIVPTEGVLDQPGQL